MAYDAQLADRFRTALSGIEGVSEKRMMGGVCFLVNGNMLGGADRTKNGTGRFMFRVGKENEQEALARDGAEKMIMGKRRMSGFIFVEESICDSDVLGEWVSLAMTYVGVLPPK